MFEVLSKASEKGLNQDQVFSRVPDAPPVFRRAWSPSDDSRLLHDATTSLSALDHSHPSRNVSSSCASPRLGAAAPAEHPLSSPLSWRSVRLFSSPSSQRRRGATPPPARALLPLLPQLSRALLSHLTVLSFSSPPARLVALLLAAGFGPLPAALGLATHLLVDLAAAEWWPVAPRLSASDDEVTAYIDAATATTTTTTPHHHTAVGPPDSRRTRAALAYLAWHATWLTAAAGCYVGLRRGGGGGDSRDQGEGEGSRAAVHADSLAGLGALVVGAVVARLGTLGFRGEVQDGLQNEGFAGQKRPDERAARHQLFHGLRIEPTASKQEIERDSPGPLDAAETSTLTGLDALSFVLTIIFYRPDQFIWPLLVTLVSTYTACVLYAVYLVPKHRGIL